MELKHKSKRVFTTAMKTSVEKFDCLWELRGAQLGYCISYSNTWSFSEAYQRFYISSIPDSHWVHFMLACLKTENKKSINANI